MSAPPVWRVWSGLSPTDAGATFLRRTGFLRGGMTRMIPPRVRNPIRCGWQWRCTGSPAASAVREIRQEIPQQYWTGARCVLVIPELKKAAFIVGGEYGKGVMSCRAGDQWSAPVV